jgi:hypothetical protein
MMTIDTPRVRLPNIVLKGARALGRLLPGFETSQHGAPAARPLLTPEQFQEELAILGFSGRKFGPEKYSEALGNYLGISIAIHVIPDACYPELSRRLAFLGILAELRYSEESGLAVIIVLESLPPLVLALTVYHELGHLAAGDLLIEPEENRDGVSYEHAEKASFATARVGRGRRLARALPLADEAFREHEADLRASYALVAGCLGSESPYAHCMYDIL